MTVADLLRFMNKREGDRQRDEKSRADVVQQVASFPLSTAVFFIITTLPIFVWTTQVLAVFS